jgi:Ca2+-binding RTX toxin-like protein
MISTSSLDSGTTSATGFPDASNTGVSSGTPLTVFYGTYYVTKDNAVISNLEVHGSIVIEADNVTMTNIKLVSDTPWHALRVMDNATGFTLTDSEIDGGGSTVNAIYGFGTFLRNDLHDVDNGINVVGPSLIQDNYMHDFRGGSDAHYDGIEINGGGGHDIDIIHNTIINAHSQTSAIMMNNEFGGLKNITIEGNRLVGGGYTVYLDGRKGGGTVDDGSISITNNQIGGGHWGDFAFYDDDPVVYGNVDLDTMPTTDTGTDTGSIPPAGIVYTGTEGDDILPSGKAPNGDDETYQGLGGNDLLDGGAGGDVLDGGNGIDTASYTASAAVKINLKAGTASGGHANGDTFVGIENLSGSRYADMLEGNDSANVLTGAAGNDTLSGGAGSDRLVGNTGNDILEGQGGSDYLYGGRGADMFVFRESGLNAADADHINAFRSDDLIVFDTNSGATGALSANAFRQGTAALDGDDRFIYDTAKHELYYDADGNGAGEKVLVATLDDGYKLTANDIWQI